MVGHRDTAGRAGNSLSAASAGYEIVVSAAVDEEYGLVALFLCAHKLLAKLVSERRGHAAARILSHIDDRDLWELCTSVAVLELDKRVFSFLSLIVALKGRSCGCEQHKRVLLADSVARHVSCVVLGVAVGFIGVLLLLVNNYKSEVVKRSENGRARADNYVSTAALYSFVGVESLALRESRVDYRHAATVA